MKDPLLFTPGPLTTARPSKPRCNTTLVRATPTSSSWWQAFARNYSASPVSRANRVTKPYLCREAERLGSSRSFHQSSRGKADSWCWQTALMANAWLRSRSDREFPPDWHAGRRTNRRTLPAYNTSSRKNRPRRMWQSCIAKRPPAF